MANITEELIAIANAVKGIDVRDAIYNALQKIDNEVSGIQSSFTVYGADILDIAANTVIAAMQASIESLSEALEAKANASDVQSALGNKADISSLSSVRSEILSYTNNVLTTGVQIQNVSWSAGSVGSLAVVKESPDIKKEGWTPISYRVGLIGTNPDSPVGYGTVSSFSTNQTTGERKANIAIFRANTSAQSNLTVSLYTTYIKDPPATEEEEES